MPPVISTTATMDEAHRAAALGIGPWNGRLQWQPTSPLQIIRPLTGALVEYGRWPVPKTREMNFSSTRNILMFAIRWTARDAEFDIGERHPLPPDISGRFGFFPAGTGIRGHVVPAGPQAYMQIHFDSVAGLVDPTLDDADLGLEPEPLFRNDAAAGVARALVASLESTGPYDRLYGDLLVTAIAVELTRRRLDGRQPQARGGLSRRQTRLAVDFLESHLTEEVTLQALAEMVGLSPWHFARAFKRTTGLPPHRWLTARRIERAKTLLADHALSITDVALACGFGGSSQFTRGFKHATGMTPSAFRRGTW